MNGNGVRLACRYSWVCERAREFRISEALRAFLESKDRSTEKLKEVRGLLTILTSRQFYQQIAEINGIKDPFDPRVVSHYWKGTPDMKGGLWHNYTTLLPVSRLPAMHIQPEMVDSCFVHPARVEGLRKKGVLVSYLPVLRKGEKILLADEPREIVAENDIGELESGDWITIHFATAIEKITAVQAELLLGATRSSLEKFDRRAKK